jgi:hypothetical protein
MANIKIEKISYRGWENCIRIANGIVDLIITVDVGPRIIRYGFIGRENEFCEIGATLGAKGGDEWRIYGGHRLWHAPEDRKRTYEPDNFPVKWEKVPDGIKTMQDIEPLTGIKKEMEIALSPEDSSVRILHRLTNSGKQAVELSVWSISAMATGGKEIIPVAGTDTGLLPNRCMVLWPYTRLDDQRLNFLDRFIIVQHDPGIKEPLKLGASNENGWAAHFNRNRLFIKYYTHDREARYPDLGASYETYVNDFMLEMETLSPFTLLEPGKYAEHSEIWDLFDNVPAPDNDSAEIEAVLKDKISRIK